MILLVDDAHWADVDSLRALLFALRRRVAVEVYASRGSGRPPETHVERAATESGDYELMIVAAALAEADRASVRGDHEQVLDALEPLHAIQRREGVDEPGFWPWQHLYGDALIAAGQLEKAAAFLAPHEKLAQDLNRRSAITRLARVRGRLEGAAGRTDAAEAAFRYGIEQLDGLSLPFERAALDLAYGQMLRRRGHRRAAALRLEAAQERFTALGARPYVERCARELKGSGLAPAKRSNADPARLTPQELAVARLAATGMSNRDIASEMAISGKTVQFHVGNVYAELGVRSRLQLAHRLGDTRTPGSPPGES